MVLPYSLIKKELMKYKCGWCKNKFEQEVGTFGEASGGCSQVVCPYCKNRLRPMKDAI